VTAPFGNLRILPKSIGNFALSLSFNARKTRFIKQSRSILHDARGRVGSPHYCGKRQVFRVKTAVLARPKIEAIADSRATMSADS